MELKDIVSISGLGGLFEIVAKRTDGMIVRNLDEQKSQFISSRVHIFTPLDAITIYTGEKDTTELYKVLLEMKKQEKTNPVADSNADGSVLKKYFEKVLPDYNEEKVYVSDIKKVIKWYQLLDKHKLVNEEDLTPKAKEEVKTEDEQEGETKTEKKEVVEKAKTKHAKPASDRSATHSKAAVKRTAIGAKRGG